MALCVGNRAPVGSTGPHKEKKSQRKKKPKKAVHLGVISRSRTVNDVSVGGESFIGANGLRERVMQFFSTLALCGSLFSRRVECSSHFVCPPRCIASLGHLSS